MLDLICKYYVENYCIYINKGYWIAIYFSCMIFVRFSYQDNAGNELPAPFQFSETVCVGLCAKKRPDSLKSHTFLEGPDFVTGPWLALKK